jgi:hypothetical protein
MTLSVGGGEKDASETGSWGDVMTSARYEASWTTRRTYERADLTRCGASRKRTRATARRGTANRGAFVTKRVIGSCWF